jgi:diguanylate cyclase (GGDEF)-like protein
MMGIAGKNLTVVLVITCLHLVMDNTLDMRGKTFTDIAVTLSLLAFTLRAALTQHHQQEEIGRRQQAQNQLTAANGKIRVLLEDARRQTDEITQINEVGSLLQACSTPVEAYPLISERMERLFPGASGTLALLNSSKNRVESVAEWGENPPKDQNFAPNECWALRRGCVHALADGTSVLHCSHLRSTSSSVCIPLVAAGNAIGTLAIEGGIQQDPANAGDQAAESAPFEHHRDLVVAVAEHISLALADLQLREALRTQAVRDPLTGLYNRRYMQEFLDRETHRARRKNRPLAVLALDLDHFKSFNDNYGHAAGDYVLSLVGDVLLHSVRADDVACRYGGEEFIMILPECNLQQAMKRAEQIRIRLQQRPMEYQGVSQKTVTVSIGVAALDETTDRIERLLRCADEALYEAKRTGRDRAVAARPFVNEEGIPADPAVSASL